MRWIWILGLVLSIGCDGVSDDLQNESLAYTNCPLKKGEIVTYERHPFSMGNPSKGVTIHGSDSLVYSISEGIVIELEKIKGLKGYIILIESLDGTKTVYTNIKNNLVELGEEIKMGKPLGVLHIEGSEYTSELHLYKSPEFLDPKLYIDCECRIND